MLKCVNTLHSARFLYLKYYTLQDCSVFTTVYSSVETPSQSQVLRITPHDAQNSSDNLVWVSVLGDLVNETRKYTQFLNGPFLLLVIYMCAYYSFQEFNICRLGLHFILSLMSKFCFLQPLDFVFDNIFLLKRCEFLKMQRYHCAQICHNQGMQGTHAASLLGKRCRVITGGIQGAEIGVQVELTC